MTMLARLALTASLACPAVAGNLWIVDPALGPGATHADINSAVAAAQDGDAILVRAGNYLEHVAIQAKSLSLTAEKGATVRVLSVKIENVSAGDSVIVSGLRADIGGLVTTPPFRISACAGPVWIQDCVAHVGVSTFVQPIPVLIHDSAAVTLQRCDLQAGSGVPASGLVAVDSNVHLFDSFVGGGPGNASTLFSAPTAGNPGVHVVSGNLFAQGCELRGGAGGGSGPSGPCAAGADGGPGLRLEGDSPSAVLLDSVLAGGAGGSSPDPCADGAAGPASEVLAGSIATLPGSARSLSVPQPVREGESTAIALDGQPNDLAWILVSGAQLPHAPWFGTGVLLVAEPFTITFAGSLGAGGQKLVPVTLGEIGLTYTPVFLQGVFFSPAENFPHSSGAMALLLDASVP